jgi:hypothetical protein
MKSLIVLFNLKEGVSASDYEAFAKELDIPTVKSLKSVSTPPYQYVEVIHFDSIENLVSDMGKEPKMAEIPAKFQEFADNPIFIVSDLI